MYDVLVIGAGVVGAAIARRLSSFRCAVALVESRADVSFGVSKANSGIIHAGFHHSPSSLRGRLEIQGNKAFDTLHEELGFPFRRSGIVVAAFSIEEMKVVDLLYAQGVENGSPGLEIVGRDRLLSLEPTLSRDVVGGLFAPSGGIIEPYRFVFALVESAVRNGVQLRTGWNAVAARWDGSAWHVRADAGEEMQARWVVNAAGLQADIVSSLFGGETFTIIPRKGEEFILDKGAGGPPRRVIFPVPARASKGVLVIPTVEGTVMIGPTADEGEDKEDTSTTPENLARVFSLASRMVPAISARDIITSFAGLRPTLPGDDFFIELSRGAPHFVQVAGIQSPGLTASPGIAERVREILSEAGLLLEANPGWVPSLPRVLRTRDHADAALEALVARDPAFGHMVCRCEGVSEAEVVEAIHKGHTTLDGIKYYTRAGMGRCQGGFCTYRIMRILSRETGLPLEKVTRRGPGSELVVGRLGDQPNAPVGSPTAPGAAAKAPGAPA